MKKGFTLIEVIIVIVVVGIGIAGMATGLQNILYHSHKPEVISTASLLAVAEAERVIGLAFSSVADEYRNSPANYTGNFSGYSYEIRVDSIDTAEPSLGSDSSMQTYKVVEVRVHHEGINYVSLVFLKANNSTS